MGLSTVKMNWIMEQKQEKLLMKRWELWAASALCVVAAIILVPFVRPVTDQFVFWVISLQVGGREEAISLLSEGGIMTEMFFNILPFLAFLLALWCITLAVRFIADSIHLLIKKK